MSKKTFTRAGRFAIALNVLLSSVLALAVGGGLIYIGFLPDVRQRADLTPRQDYTLDDKTLVVLENSNTEVDVYTCFSPNDFNSSRAYVPGLALVMDTIGRYTNDLLKEYELEGGGKVRVHAYDPQITGHITRIVELSQKLGEPAQNVVLVESGTRRRVLRLPDLADYDEGAEHTQNYRRPQLYGFTAQQSITSAILAVTEEDPTTIGFVVGHGERDVEAGRIDPTGRGAYGAVGRALGIENYQLAKVDLGGTDLDAEDLDILVLAAPNEEIPEPEIEVLVRYLESGGHMMLLFERETPIGLDFPLLDQTLGLKRLDGRINISLSDRVWERRPYIFEEVNYSQHPIVDLLRDKGLRTFWDGAVAFETLGRAGQSSIKQATLIWTVDRAWLDRPDEDGEYNESYDPGTETQGSQPFGYALELPLERGGGRVVVLGDSDFCDDLHIASQPGNRPLFLNAMNWLADREELIVLDELRYDELRVDLTPDEYETIFSYVVGAIPALALLMALAVFWMRRS